MIWIGLGWIGKDWFCLGWLGKDWYGSKNKVERIFIRAYVIGILNQTQKKIASFLGYQYLTYEEYFLTKQKCNLKDFLFITILYLLKT